MPKPHYSVLMAFCLAVAAWAQIAAVSRRPQRQPEFVADRPSPAAAASANVQSKAAEPLPACNTQVLTRRGNTVTIELPTLSRLLNRGLHAAHYQFHDLDLTSPSPGQLRVTLQRKGKTFSLSGPLQATPRGVLRLHATSIMENGSGVEGLMSLFGQDLADYLKLQRSRAMRVRQNDLFIYPDRLLHLHGQVQSLQLSGRQLRLQYVSPPCR